MNNATGVYNSPAVTSGIYESRSFVRLQDVSLSYTFESPIAEQIKSETHVRSYISSKNPYIWTQMVSGWDPEVVGWNATDGNTNTNTPLMRNITAGFRVTF